MKDWSTAHSWYLTSLFSFHSSALSAFSLEPKSPPEAPDDGEGQKQSPAYSIPPNPPGVRMALSPPCPPAMIDPYGRGRRGRDDFFGSSHRSVGAGCHPADEITICLATVPGVAGVSEGAGRNGRT
jgi:hypothetical protein